MKKSSAHFLRPLVLSVGIILMADFLLCGCETVKRARKAQTATDRFPGEKTVTAAEARLIAGQTLALADLEQIALRYHPSLLQARQDVESASIQCRITHAGRLPQISASGAYTRESQNTQYRPKSMRSEETWSGSVGLDLLLYDFGKLSAQERQSRESLVAAEQQLRATEIDTVYAVRSAFFELHRSAELFRVARESERQYAEHLEEARVMAQIGTRRQYDVTKAEVDWGNALLDEITASNTLVTTRAQLNNAIGLCDYPVYEISTNLLTAHFAPDTQALMARAEENTPSLAVLRAKTRAASAYVDQTVAELYPDLTLGADLAASGREFPINWNYSWALRAAQNLFDGRKNTARIDYAVTQLRIARAAEAKEEQSLYLDLVTAVAQYQSARKRREIAELVVRQATDNRDIVNEQYRVGLSSSIERTDAQVAVTQALADVVRARYDEQAAQAGIARLVGEPAAPVPEPRENTP